MSVGLNECLSILSLMSVGLNEWKCLAMVDAQTATDLSIRTQALTDLLEVKINRLGSRHAHAMQAVCKRRKAYTTKTSVEVNSHDHRWLVFWIVMPCKCSGSQGVQCHAVGKPYFLTL